MKFHTHFMMTCFVITWSKKISHQFHMFWPCEKEDNISHGHFTWKWCEIAMWNACNSHGHFAYISHAFHMAPSSSELLTFLILCLFPMISAFASSDLLSHIRASNLSFSSDIILANPKKGTQKMVSPKCSS